MYSNEDEVHLLRESGRLGLEATPKNWPQDWHAWIGAEPDAWGRVGVWVFVADCAAGSEESFVTPRFDTIEEAGQVATAYLHSVTGLLAAFQPPEAALNRLAIIQSTYDAKTVRLQ